MRRVRFQIALLIAWLCQPVGFASGAEDQAAKHSGVEFFERRIRPVLIKHCYACHSAKAKKPKGGLRLDTVAGIRRGGESGVLFDGKSAKKPDASRLIRAVSYGGDFFDMPPAGKLPKRVIADFRRWVALGSPLPAGTEAGGPQPQKSVDIAKGRSFWSFQPVKPLPAPRIKRRGWARRKIDRFILHRLEANGMKPSPAADRRVLIRRVSLDLTGLPPTYEETRRFIADRSPDAYERLVERLLASPHYGERWGRHWLDVARYAEDNPTSESTCKPPRYPYPYRDWVIRALNDDLPYDEFVRRQLAADLMAALPPSEIAATGFLGLSPVYHKEPKLSRDVILAITADEWDERLDTVTRGLLGLTVACARCHDHKFDPIKREDYYALAGMMASTQLVEWPLARVDRKTASDVSDTRLAIVDLQLRVSYARTMRNTAKEKGRPSAKYEAERKRLQAKLDRLKAKKLFDGPLVNGVRDAGVWIDGSDPAWTELDFKPGTPRDLPIFIRGSVTNPGPIVKRRFVEVLANGKPQPFRTGSGRLEFANAMFNDARSLSARVIVNRVWGWHFGQPLVRTPSNFGKLGDAPSHPRLLEDLAARFIRADWSLKWLHREIVLSATYRQSSRVPEQASTRDPGNRLLSRMNRRRLEPEAWRDAVLQISGRLDLKMGGKSESLDKPDAFRRSVYGKISRQKPADILRLWDFPDAKFHAASRTLTTTPLQQLYLLNSGFLRQASERLTASLGGTLPGTVASRRRLSIGLFRRILLRDPTADELRAATALLRGSSKEARRLPAHGLFAGNEFLFVD